MADSGPHPDWDVAHVAGKMIHSCSEEAWLEPTCFNQSGL